MAAEGRLLFHSPIRVPNEPPPVPRRTEIVFELMFPATRSDLTSPFRSPIATELGDFPVGWSERSPKAPVPVREKSKRCSNLHRLLPGRDTVPATRSPIATEMSTDANTRSVQDQGLHWRFQAARTAFGSCIRDSDVRPTIRIQVADCDRNGAWRPPEVRIVRGEVAVSHHPPIVFKLLPG